MVASKSRQPADAPLASTQGVFRAIPLKSAVANVQHSQVVDATKKNIPKSQRQNRKGWMEGLREELICPLIPGYVDALEISKAAGALKMKELQHLFHSYFPWPLEDWEEPPRPLNRYDPLAPLAPPDNLTSERAAMWAKHMNTTNKRLERWIKWRIGASPRRAATGTRQNDPNDPLALMVLHLFGAKKRVKARSGAQQYQHDEYTVSGMEAVVESEFAKREDKSTKKIPLALKQKVARQFFAKLSKEEQDGWVAKAKAAADIERTKAKASCKAEPSENPTVIATCVRNTPALLAKISQALDVHAKVKTFTMVAGPMGMYDGEVGYFDVTTTKNSGGTGMSFMEWLGPERASGLVEAYMMYVETCVTDVDKARVITPDATVPDWAKTHKAVSDRNHRTASFRGASDADAEGLLDEDDEDENEDGDEDDNANAEVDTATPKPGRRRGKAATKTTAPALAPELMSSAPIPPPVAVITTPVTLAQATFGDTGDAIPKPRPRPRPSWTRFAGDVSEDEEVSMATRKAALQALRQKRAHRRQLADCDSDEEEVDDEARETKRQRLGLIDITNMELPAEPGMDTGRFFTEEGKVIRLPTPAGNPSPTPVHGRGRESTPAAESRQSSPMRDISPTNFSATDPSPSPVRGRGREPTPAAESRQSSPMRDISPTNFSATDPSPSPVRGRGREPTPAAESRQSSPMRDISPARGGEHESTLESAEPRSASDDFLDRLTGEEISGVEWLSEPLREFVMAEGGSDMLGVFDRLCRLERQYVLAGKYAKKRATLARGKNTDGTERLKWLGDWVAGGRTRGRRQVVDKAVLPKFVKEWSAWWGSLQPTWRKKKHASFARDVDPAPDQQFDAITVPGANGMLSVVATLSWWRSAAPVGRAKEQWASALVDVEWVMDVLIERAQGSDITRN